MTLKEYFEQGNEIYYFTPEQIAELSSLLEAWENASKAKND